MTALMLWLLVAVPTRPLRHRGVIMDEDWKPATKKEMRWFWGSCLVGIIFWAVIIWLVLR